jgi:hypothetical protein
MSMRDLTAPRSAAEEVISPRAASIPVMYSSRVVWSAALSVNAEMSMLEIENVPDAEIAPVASRVPSRIPLWSFASYSLLVAVSTLIVPIDTEPPVRVKEETMLFVAL